MTPFVLCIAGLPGTGKTTISRLVAAQTGAIHLRIDTIETAIMTSHLAVEDLMDAGYAVALALGGEHLAAGRSVIADAVHAEGDSRAAWRRTAAGYRWLSVELQLADQALHRQRIESRKPDLPGQRVPNWADVRVRSYLPWDSADLHIDTGKSSAAQACAMICAALEQ